MDLAVNNTGIYGLYGNGSIFYNVTDNANTCGYQGRLPNNNSPKFDTNCASTDQIVAHYYIAGFKYNPAGSTNKLAVSALIDNYLTKANKAVFGTGTVSQGWGPLVALDNNGGALKRIKVSMILTTLRNYIGYPANNVQNFAYSGVYMPIDIKNVDRPIIKGAAGAYNV